MSIANIVNVNVTKTGATVSQAGLGTPLLLAQVDVAIQANRFATYTTVAELTALGFASDSAAVEWAGIVLAQDTTPDKFAIGRRVPGTAQSDRITITTAAVGTWSVDINGITYSYVAGASDTETQIAQGLADNINNGIPSPEPVNASTAVAGVSDVVADVGGLAFTNGGIVVAGGGVGTFVNTVANVAAEDITVALDAVEAENANDWYFLNIEEREDTPITDAAAWVASRKKILVVQTSDPDVLTATQPNIGSVLQALNYKRVMVLWHDDDREWLDAGMTSIAAAADLDAENGVITWHGKQVVGVPVDTLTSGQILAAAGDNEADKGEGVNVYVEVAGRGFISYGASVEGEFMDVQTTLDWTEFRVQEAVFGRIATTPTKVPGTNSGIASMSNEVLGVLNTGVANGHFTTDTPTKVTSPTNQERSTTDRNNRTLRNVIGTAQLAGAIHKTIIQVNVAA